MSVGEQLGLDDPNDRLRVQARARWNLWADRYPQLGAFVGPESLREWLRGADPDARDEALSALGALGSRDGMDDCAAAGALLWVPLPGASLLARRLRGFSLSSRRTSGVQQHLELGRWAGSSLWERRTRAPGPSLRRHRSCVNETSSRCPDVPGETPVAGKALVLCWAASCGCRPDVVRTVSGLLTGRSTRTAELRLPQPGTSEAKSRHPPRRPSVGRVPTRRGWRRARPWRSCGPPAG